MWNERCDWLFLYFAQRTTLLPKHTHTMFYVVNARSSHHQLFRKRPITVVSQSSFSLRLMLHFVTERGSVYKCICVCVGLFTSLPIVSRFVGNRRRYTNTKKTPRSKRSRQLPRQIDWDFKKEELYVFCFCKQGDWGRVHSRASWSQTVD